MLLVFIPAVGEVLTKVDVVIGEYRCVYVYCGLGVLINITALTHIYILRYESACVTVIAVCIT